MPDDQLPMKTSQQEPSKQLRSSQDDPAKRISASLAKLALHYWRPDYTPAQANLLMMDYLNDLKGITPEAVEAACEKYRKNEKNSFFPRSGQLLALIDEKKPKEVLERHARPFRGYPALTERRATKSVAEVLRENGHFAAAEAWRKNN